MLKNFDVKGTVGTLVTVMAALVIYDMVAKPMIAKKSVGSPAVAPSAE